MSTVNVETDQNPSLMLAGNPASAQTSRFLKRVHLLAQSFGVEIVAVIAHHRVTEANKSVDPIEELTRAIQCLARYCTQQKVIGLWVDETNSVRHFNVIQDSEE
jgi:hypothetical protein